MNINNNHKGLDLNQIQQDAKELIEKVKYDVTHTPPKNWAISYTISLLFCLAYSGCFRAKEQALINFPMFFYSIILVLIAVIVRSKTPGNQYPWSVVLMCLVGLIVPRSNLANLSLSAIPVIINRIEVEITKKV